MMSKEEEEDAMSIDDDDDDEGEESSDSSDSESSDSGDDDDEDDDESFGDNGADASGVPEAAVTKHKNGAGTNGVSYNREAKLQSQTPPSAVVAASAAVAASSTPVPMVKQENATPVEPAPVENKTAQPVADPQPPVAVKAEPSTTESSENGANNGSGPSIADGKKQETVIVDDVIMQGTAEAPATTEVADVVMAEAASPETKGAPPKEIEKEPKPSIETQPTHAIDQESLKAKAKTSSESKPKLKIKLKLGNKAATVEGNAKSSSLPAVSIKTEPVGTEITNGNGAENGNATKAATSISPSATGEPPAKKKKLSIVLKTKVPLTEKEASTGSTSTTVVKAEVVDDDGKAADVVAKVIETPTTKNSGKAPTATATTTKAKKKAPSLFKPARLPPMTSPGMFLSHNAAGISQASSALFRTAMDKKTCLAKPSILFDQSMASAGYTTEGRNKNPHRGSSVQKTVGDMFDSNVIFTPHFPELVPQELWNAHAQPKQQTQQNQLENKEQSNASAGDTASGKSAAEAKLSLPELLMKQLKNDSKKAEIQREDHSSLTNSREHGGRKRPRPLQFTDMIPVSLTLPYPDSFLNQNQQYAKKVQEREDAIVLYQEAQEKLQAEKEQNEFLYGKPELSGEQPKPGNSVVIPPIPSKPTPPLLSELKGFGAEQYEDKYPLYFPKGKSSFVAHLDPDFFHVSEGRYFGLSSNTIADPHFVGASAPGLVAQTLSAGSVLATATTNSQGTGALLAVPMPTANLSSSSGGVSSSKAQKKKDSGTKKTSKNAAPAPAAKSSSKTKINLKHAGLIPTATTSDLRKVLEKNDEMATKMKDCIIRAAVHVSRGEKHGLAFLGPDGNIYPDASKAFAAHGGMKPCAKCKGNKQGAYHCRLRRKHQEVDFDGDNSSSDLAALMTVPLEELVLNRKDLDTS